MSAFEDQLKSMFAAAPEPAADEAFVRVVAERVSKRERARLFATQVSYGACALAGAGVLNVCWLMLHRLLPPALLKPATLSAVIAAPAHAPSAPILVQLLPLLVGAAVVSIGVTAAAISYLRTRE